jgi:hypothetical protein
VLSATSSAPATLCFSTKLAESRRSLQLRQWPLLVLFDCRVEGIGGSETFAASGRKTLVVIKAALD